MAEINVPSSELPLELFKCNGFLSLGTEAHLQHREANCLGALTRSITFQPKRTLSVLGADKSLN